MGEEKSEVNLREEGQNLVRRRAGRRRERDELTESGRRSRRRSKNRLNVRRVDAPQLVGSVERGPRRSKRIDEARQSQAGSERPVVLHHVGEGVVGGNEAVNEHSETEKVGRSGADQGLVGAGGGRDERRCGDGRRDVLREGVGERDGDDEKDGEEEGGKKLHRFRSRRRRGGERGEVEEVRVRRKRGASEGKRREEKKEEEEGRGKRLGKTKEATPVGVIFDAGRGLCPVLSALVVLPCRHSK